MSMPAAEQRTLRPCAIFSVVDTFVTLRGVDGPASARHVRGTLAFQLTAIGSGAARLSFDPAWTLPVVQGASGAFISYGTIVDPGGDRRRPIGPPLAFAATVVGPAYRPTALPLAAAPGQPAAAGPQLVNLDPAQPTVTVTPFPVPLGPGYDYPFPASPAGYSIVRGDARHGASGPGVNQAQVTGSAVAGNWSDSYLTDSTGQWVFVIPDAQAGEITIVARDATGATAQQTANVAASSMVAVPPLTFT
jgi:hypothetical protein